MSIRKQQIFEFRVKIEFRPQASKNSLRVLVDGLNEAQASQAELIQARVAVQSGDLLPQPRPKSLHGVQVRAVGR